MNRIYHEQLPCGMWLLGEQIESARSLSLSFLLPAGVTAEPQGQQGAATMLAEIICRGAGGLNAREHCDALDRLGIQRNTSVETHHVRLDATMIGTKLDEGLELLVDMVLNPSLAQESLEPTRDLSLQTIDSLEDEPQEKVFLELRQRHNPPPLGRSPLGCKQDLESIELESLRQFWKTTYVAGGSALAFAGSFDWPRLRELVSQRLDQWSGSLEPCKPEGTAQRGYLHLQADTTQVHIATAYDAVPDPSEDSLLQRAATAVLSGGMSGRLFTEVREKRGLCYAVYATYAGQKDRGAVFSYAGTTVPRAQDTLEVLLSELRRLSDGIEHDEFDRAKVGMKSRLVMQGESTSARAGALATDQYILGRPRSLGELADRVDRITFDQVNAFIQNHRPGPMTVVTIGPEPLNVPL